MSYLASVAMTEAAEVYLNDSARAHYTDAVLLPHLKAAYRDLQLELFANGLVILEETSAALTLPALGQSLNDAGVLPTDFIQPVQVFERALATDLWQEVHKKDWEDLDSAAYYTYLGTYAWREQDIKFRGCNRAMFVLLRYRKELSALTTANSPIALFNSLPYLSARTAFYAAGFGGANETRAKAINVIAEVALRKLTATQVREASQPTRRRPYGYGRRTRNRFS